MPISKKTIILYIINITLKKKFIFLLKEYLKINLANILCM